MNALRFDLISVDDESASSRVAFLCRRRRFEEFAAVMIRLI